MRIFFTGGSGKAGRHAIAHLVDQGHDVTNADLVPARLAHVPDLRVDLTDAGQVFDALSSYARHSELEPGTGVPRYDAVVHFAAVPAILIRPDNETFRVNALSTYNVIDAAIRLGIPKVIFASSETTYGICFADGELRPHYVPIDEEHVGETANRSRPSIKQLFIEAGPGHRDDQDAFERKLYVIRRIVELAAGPDFYAPSFSSRTIVYKGMLISTQLRRFFADLSDERFASAVALVHSRFSTNTFPSWELAHPFRVIAHNGEINTLMGNKNWMRARESQLASDLFGMDLQSSIDAARFRHVSGQRLALEQPVGDAIRATLTSMGHALIDERPVSFGGAQAIVRLAKGYGAGSDSRKDGMAVGY